MILITGPLYSGKRAFARQLLGCGETEWEQAAVWDVQCRAKADSTPQQLEQLAEELAQYKVVIATEVGGGVVPMDAAERAWRENAGRLSCLLAQRADTVVRVFCGLPLVLKGELTQK
jgi:adenosylcobinamide kinase/adenosylcobinamide-phosphate guanylyltransferase